MTALLPAFVVAAVLSMLSLLLLFLGCGNSLCSGCDFSSVFVCDCDFWLLMAILCAHLLYSFFFFLSLFSLFFFL